MMKTSHSVSGKSFTSVSLITSPKRQSEIGLKQHLLANNHKKLLEFSALNEVRKKCKALKSLHVSLILQDPLVIFDGCVKVERG